MYSRLFKLFILLLTLTLVLSCSSGGGGDSTVDDSTTESTTESTTDDSADETTPEESVPSVTGKFIDSAVSGLSYTCSPSAKSGVTNSSGEFTCDEGDTVTFKLGDITLGSAVSVTTTVVTPYTIFPDNEDAAINLAQLLQTIDSDLTDDIITPLSSHVESLGETLDFQRDDFDTYAASLLSGIVTLISADEAKETMDEFIISIGVTPPEQVVVPAVIPLYDADMDCYFPYLANGNSETKLADICTATPYNMQSRSAFVNGKHFFVDYTLGIYHLSISGGTASTTTSFDNIVTTDGHVTDLVAADTKVYFYTDFIDDHLWVSDGSEAGTSLISVPPLMDISSLTVSGDNLYFRTYDMVYDTELWISDGTISGTKMVKDINPSASSSPSYLTAVNDKLFFSANNGTNGYELWVSDGTESGTTMVKDIYSGVSSSSPQNLTASGDKLFFRATEDDISHIWLSDGTESGTQKVPDTASLSISSLVSINGIVYFTLYSDNKVYRVDENGKYVSAQFAEDETALMLYKANDTVYALGGAMPLPAPSLHRGIALPVDQDIYKGYPQSDGSIDFSKINSTIEGVTNLQCEFYIFMSVVGDVVYLQVRYTDANSNSQTSMAKIADGELTLVGIPYMAMPD